jgi:predicted HTH domain antitoxin
MLNINIGHNKQLFDKCKILWEYSMFISETRKYIKEKKEIVAGVKKAVEECIKKNILKEFLKEKESEVIAMCLFKFDKEKYENTIRLEGEKKGEKKGKKEGKIEALIGLVKDKIISLQEAASRMGMTVEKFEKEARNLALY